MKKDSPSKRYFTPLSVLGLDNPQIAQMTSSRCLFSLLKAPSGVGKCCFHRIRHHPTDEKVELCV